MPVYLVYLLAFFAPPVLALAWLLRREARRFPRTILWSLLFVYALGLPWDVLSTRTGVWRYDVAPTVGIWLDRLPIEEFVGFNVLAVLLIDAAVLLALKGWRHV